MNLMLTDRLKCLQTLMKKRPRLESVKVQISQASQEESEHHMRTS